MGEVRKSFQGVGNIIRFNWHFYVISVSLLFLLLATNNYLDTSLHLYAMIICFFIVFTLVISLFVSYYIYDVSGFYNLIWIKDTSVTGDITLNINAGFDETSALLKETFKYTTLVSFDFYDPTKHKEISIKRARKAYPAFEGTMQINTNHIPLANHAVDRIFVILSAHEIRNEVERMMFFKELSRVIKPSGKIFIIEHLRDAANFLAYTIGFFHFYSKASWCSIFKNADLMIEKEIKHTPFISIFILQKYGNTF